MSPNGNSSSTRSKTPGYTPLAASVADHLREAIISGRYKVGERIRQEAVAEEVGTSRIPVREALNRLQNEGLVTITSHVGARVARLDFDELDEAYLIRERLESLAISRSAPHLTNRQLKALEGLLSEMDASAEAKDLSLWVDLDRRFHLATYQAANLPRLLTMIEGLWNATQQYRRAYTGLPERLSIAAAEHRLIMQALQRHDAEAAEQLSLMHIRRTRLTLGEHRELFEEP